MVGVDVVHDEVGVVSGCVLWVEMECECEEAMDRDLEVASGALGNFQRPVHMGAPHVVVGGVGGQKTRSGKRLAVEKQRFEPASVHCKGLYETNPNRRTDASGRAGREKGSREVSSWARSSSGLSLRS